MADRLATLAVTVHGIVGDDRRTQASSRLLPAPLLSGPARILVRAQGSDAVPVPHRLSPGRKEETVSHGPEEAEPDDAPTAPLPVRGADPAPTVPNQQLPRDSCTPLCGYPRP